MDDAYLNADYSDAAIMAHARRQAEKEDRREARAECQSEHSDPVPSSAAPPLAQSRPSPCALRRKLVPHRRKPISAISDAPSGFRCLAKQPTGAISFEEFARAHDAMNFANSKGHLMNVEMTVVPKFCGRNGEAEADEVFRRLFKSYGDTCRRWPCPAMHIAAFENSRKRGVHFHSMIAVPPEQLADFRKWMQETKSWLGASNSKDGRVLDYTIRDSATAVSQVRWFEYLMKGLEPNGIFRSRALAGLQTKDLIKLRRFQAGGSLSIKRVRISEAISASNQRLEPFVGKASYELRRDFDWRLPYGLALYEYEQECQRIREAEKQMVASWVEAGRL